MNLHIDRNKSYGIMLSGGLDSAVLLYLIINQQPSVKLQPFTIDKTDGSSLYVNKIVDHFNKKFNLSIPYTIYVGDPTAHHRLQSTTAVIDIFNNYSVDYLFNGINQNPLELNDLPGAPKRDKESKDARIIFPFVNLLKTDILKIMFEEKQDDLMYITHSCTEQKIGPTNASLEGT
jgi:hypothetical protein